MALILVICQKIGQMGLTLAMLTKSAFLGGGPMPGTVSTTLSRSSVRFRSDEQQLRNRARQSEQNLEKQSAELAEQVRATNAPLQEESTQLRRGA